MLRHLDNAWKVKLHVYNGSRMNKLAPKIEVAFFQKRIDAFAAFGIVGARDKAIAFQRHLTGDIVLWRVA